MKLSERERSATVHLLSEQVVLQSFVEAMRSRLGPIRGLQEATRQQAQTEAEQLTEFFEFYDSLPSLPMKFIKGLFKPDDDYK